jgi:hypothetical protein
VSVDDLEGIEMTLEILGDSDAVARISESLAAPGRGERGVDLAMVRADLARRRHSGAVGQDGYIANEADGRTATARTHHYRRGERQPAWHASDESLSSVTGLSAPLRIMCLLTSGKCHHAVRQADRGQRA